MVSKRFASISGFPKTLPAYSFQKKFPAYSFQKICQHIVSKKILPAYRYQKN